LNWPRGVGFACARPTPPFLNDFPAGDPAAIFGAAFFLLLPLLGALRRGYCLVLAARS
jgi:hypothetical protein